MPVSQGTLPSLPPSPPGGGATSSTSCPSHVSVTQHSHPRKRLQHRVLVPFCCSIISSSNTAQQYLRHHQSFVVRLPCTSIASFCFIAPIGPFFCFLLVLSVFAVSLNSLFFGVLFSSTPFHFHPLSLLLLLLLPCVLSCLPSSDPTSLLNALEGRRGPFPAFSQAAGNLLKSHARTAGLSSGHPSQRRRSPSATPPPSSVSLRLSSANSLLEQDLSVDSPCRASARKRPATAFLFRASRARPRTQGRALRVFGPPDFLPNSLSDQFPRHRKSAPPKRSPATRLPCLRGTPPRAHTMRERQSPRLSAPARQRELLLFRTAKPRQGAVPACGC